MKKTTPVCEQFKCLFQNSILLHKALHHEASRKRVTNGIFQLLYLIKIYG